MRVLLLTQWFDPEPFPKGLAFARALVLRGFDVEVLTGFPNYPNGTVYEGYSVRAYQREVVDGSIVVHRTWLYASHDRSGVRRAANYFSFAASAVVSGMWRVARPDVIYAYHPPATVGWAGVILARRFGVPLVLDVQDLWPETVLSSGMMHGGISMRILDRMCRWGYTHADRVVALSNGMANLLANRGVKRSNLAVIPNWADESRLSLTDENAAGVARRMLGPGFCILFAGQMGEAQGLRNVLDAAALTPEITWAFLGSGSDRDRLIQEAAARNLVNVRFLDRVAMAEVSKWLEAADVLLVHLRDDRLYDASIPSKTQAYMLAGRPVLMAVRGDAARLVAAAVAGETCAPGDAPALAAAARRLASLSDAERRELGQNGRRYYWRELSCDIGVGRFADVFRDAVRARLSPST